MASGEPAVELKGSEKDEEERKEEDLTLKVLFLPSYSLAGSPLYFYFKKKKLVRLKKPRLPSALGLSGACGVEA
eukprot:scaffold4331_cov129-Isochrysis_galbana.AAC.6